MSCSSFYLIHASNSWQLCCVCWHLCCVCHHCMQCSSDCGKTAWLLVWLPGTSSRQNSCWSHCLLAISLSRSRCEMGGTRMTVQPAQSKIHNMSETHCMYHSKHTAVNGPMRLHCEGSKHKSHCCYPLIAHSLIINLGSQFWVTSWVPILWAITACGRDVH